MASSNDASDDINVKLIIRCSNSNGDREICATIEWSVRNVKEQIEKEFPNHPAPKDQRLVYAGKFMQDGAYLKDVLRLEDGQESPFIVHLVSRQATPPTKRPAGSNSSLTDSAAGHLRRRHVAPSTTGTGQQQPSQDPQQYQQQPMEWMQQFYNSQTQQQPQSSAQNAEQQQVNA